MKTKAKKKTRREDQEGELDGLIQSIVIATVEQIQ